MICILQMNSNHTPDKAQVSRTLPYPQPMDASAHSDCVHHAVVRSHLWLLPINIVYITWIKFTTFCYLVFKVTYSTKCKWRSRRCTRLPGAAWHNSHEFVQALTTIAGALSMSGSGHGHIHPHNRLDHKHWIHPCLKQLAMLLGPF